MTNRVVNNIFELIIENNAYSKIEYALFLVSYYLKLVFYNSILFKIENY